MHRLMLSPYTGDLVRAGEQRPLIEGAEADHAVRVKRLTAGDQIEALDGLGLRATGTVAETRRRPAEVVLELVGVVVEPPASPRLEVWSAPPKGDRLAMMVEQLGQVGADAWVPLQTDRSVVSPRETRLDKLRRTALESIKQSGRAWATEIGEPAGVEAAFGGDEGVRVLLADPTGEISCGEVGLAGAVTVRVLIGPEGGWSPEELAGARDRGASIVRLGPHVMRIGTAAAAAAAMLRERASR